MPHTASLIVSVLENRKSDYPIQFNVVSDGITRDSKSKALAIVDRYLGCQIVFRESPGYFEGLQEGGNFNLGTYLRFHAFELFPEIDQALYSDGDVIARADLQDLFDMNLEGYYLGVNPAFDYRYLVKSGTGFIHDRLRKDLHLSEQEVNSYFGAGILVMNLKAMRQDGVRQKLLDYLAEHLNDERFIADQETLNMVCKGKVKFYHPKFHLAVTHVQSSEGIRPFLLAQESLEFEEALRDPAMVHYCGHEKPWDTKFKKSLPFAADYRKYLAMTPWRPSFFRRLIDKISSGS